MPTSMKHGYITTVYIKKGHMDNYAKWFTQDNEQDLFGGDCRKRKDSFMTKSIECCTAELNLIPSSGKVAMLY